LTRIRRREQDLFGQWGSVWQVLRTSNGYRLLDPLDREPSRRVWCKSENPARSTEPMKNKDGARLDGARIMQEELPQAPPVRAEPSAIALRGEFVPFGIWMPQLFQRAVLAALRAGRPADRSAHSNRAMSLGRDGSLPLKPDCILEAPDQPPAVLDVKYKDPAKVAIEDVQQVVAYATAWRAPTAFLVYPTPPGSIGPLEVGGVSVHLAALDLDQPFEEAARALNEAITRLLL
jgi:hypothetical protein